MKPGNGRASPVVVDGTVLLPFSQPVDGEDATAVCDEGVAAIRLSDGETIWSKQERVSRQPSQQNFSGAPMSPQASPATDGRIVVTLGFAGLLVARDVATGDERWRIDLVERFDATPVQFGYAASPVLGGDALYVLTGGKTAGFVKLDLEGNVLWSADVGEASYATPVLVTLGGIDQVIACGRDTIYGLARDDGRTLWSHDWLEPSLTNVPTPVPLADGRLLLSGQGAQGVQIVRVSPPAAGNDGNDGNDDARAFSVAVEHESGQTQFFYCNLLRVGDSVVGCDGSLLIELDARSGKRRQRVRGWPDSNVLLLGDRLLLVGGDGRLGDCEAAAALAFPKDGRQAIDDRCWAPPVFSDGRLLIRGEATLACLRFDGVGQPLGEAAAAASDKGTLEEAGESAIVDAIVAAFESDGEAAARALYRSYEEATPKTITNRDRYLLIHHAEEAGLEAFAELIESNKDPE